MVILSDNFDTIRGCRALYIQLLGTLLKDSGLVSTHAIAAIQQGAGNYFDETVSAERRGSFAEEAHGLTSSRITLVGDDDLELGIRLDNLGARLFDATSGALWKTHLRFVTLLRRPGLPTADDPVGPKGIGRGLHGMFAAAGASDLDQKLALLDRIEDGLRQRLPAVYAEINAYLDRQGVEAAQPTILTTPEAATAGGNDPDSPPNSGNIVQAVQQMLLGSRSGEGIPLSLSGSGAVASLLGQTAVERLLSRLDDLERRGTFAAPASAGNSMASMESLIPELFAGPAASPQPKVIRSAELGIPGEASESLAIDTLAMIFEAVFSDPELPDALKTAISSLQIAILKVAMQDSSLFDDAQHVVRQALDGMEQALLGLPVDVSTRHPACARVLEIAAAVRSERADAAERFRRAAEQLAEVRSQRDRELAAACPAYLPLMDKIERRDGAARAARQACQTLLAQDAPETVRRFVATTWQNHLQQICLEHGAESREWQEGIATIETLLWSLQPKTAPEERKNLARRLPAVLQQLKLGMTLTGLAADAQEKFLDECFMLQTQALRGQPVPAAVVATGDLLPADTLALTPPPVVAGAVESEGLHLATLDHAAWQPPPVRGLPFAEGDWLGFQGIDGASQVARVCHVAAESRHVLLLNPEAGIALAVHASILDRQFREGTACNRSQTSLFERAAKRALARNTDR